MNIVLVIVLTFQTLYPPGDDDLPSGLDDQEEEDEMEYYGSGPTTPLTPNVK